MGSVQPLRSDTFHPSVGLLFSTSTALERSLPRTFPVQALLNDRRCGSSHPSLHPRQLSSLRHLSNTKLLPLSSSNRLTHGLPSPNKRSCQVSAVLPDAAAVGAIQALVDGSALEGSIADFASELLASSDVASLVSDVLPLLDSNPELAASYLVPVMAGLAYATAPPSALLGFLDYFAKPMQPRPQRFSANEVQLGRQMGEGNFGVVYEGYFSNGKTGKDRKWEKHVVLKRIKPRVEDAEEMQDVELYMNRKLQRAAPGVAAEFLGTMLVKEGEAQGKLQEGLWLVWRHQGDDTLDKLLKSREYPNNVARVLLGKELAERRGSNKEVAQWVEWEVSQAVLRQILEALRTLHGVGIVHRDLKPTNLILDEKSRRLCVIDLGACVDLRTGHNYVPNETVMDPKYCAPEKFVMPPTTTMAYPPDPLASLLSPIMWTLNTPDRFDVYSAGIMFMQLCVKQLRYEPGLNQFNKELKRANYDLNAWRKAQRRISLQEFAVLDAHDGAGWELASMLLRRRPNEDAALWTGGVLGQGRASVQEALGHRFFSLGVPEMYRRYAGIVDVEARRREKRALAEKLKAEGQKPKQPKKDKGSKTKGGGKGSDGRKPGGKGTGGGIMGGGGLVLPAISGPIAQALGGVVMAASGVPEVEEKAAQQQQQEQKQKQQQPQQPQQEGAEAGGSWWNVFGGGEESQASGSAGSTAAAAPLRGAGASSRGSQSGTPQDPKAEADTTQRGLWLGGWSFGGKAESATEGQAQGQPLGPGKKDPIATKSKDAGNAELVTGALEGQQAAKEEGPRFSGLDPFSVAISAARASALARGAPTTTANQESPGTLQVPSAASGLKAEGNAVAAGGAAAPQSNEKQPKRRIKNPVRYWNAFVDLYMKDTNQEEGSLPKELGQEKALAVLEEIESDVQGVKGIKAPLEEPSLGLKPGSLGAPEPKPEPSAVVSSSADPGHHVAVAEAVKEPEDGSAELGTEVLEVGAEVLEVRSEAPEAGTVALESDFAADKPGGAATLMEVEEVLERNERPEGAVAVASPAQEGGLVVVQADVGHTVVPTAGDGGVPQAVPQAAAQSPSRSKANGRLRSAIQTLKAVTNNEFSSGFSDDEGSDAEGTTSLWEVSAAERDRVEAQLRLLAERYAQRDAMSRSLLDAVRELDQQLGALETSVQGGQNLAKEQKRLLRKLEGLLRAEASSSLQRTE